jgi:macrolide-specific efflux system membrane fusion protein
MKYFRLILLMTSLGLISCQQKQVLRPVTGPITESVYAIGLIKSDRTYDLKMAVASSVEKYFVREGDLVTKKQKLLLIDSGAIFYAPYEGVITHLPYSIGETIAPSQSLLTMADLKKLYLEASLEQQGALKIKKGQVVQVSFESFRKSVYQGVVKTILPRNQEFVVQVDVENLPENILPGMNADLSIEILRKEKAILIPQKAISNGHLLIKKNGKVEKVKVVVGVTDAEFAEVLEPVLSPSDEMILPKENQ